MKYIRILIPITLILSLFGCSSFNNNKKFELGSSEGTGVILGTIHNTGLVSSFFIHYKSLDKAKTGVVAWQSNRNNTPIKTFALELDPGRYLFSSWKVSSPAITLQGKLSIEVLVESGTPIYIGDFEFRQSKSFGANITGIDVFYSNKFERDSEGFKENYSGIYDSIEIHNIGDPTLVGSAKFSAKRALFQALPLILLGVD